MEDKNQVNNQSVIIRINSIERKDNINDKKIYLIILCLISIIYFAITYY